MASNLGTLNFDVTLDDKEAKDKIKELKDALNSLQSKNLNIKVNDGATKELENLRKQLETVTALGSNIKINVSQLDALQKLQGNISNITLDQSIIDSIVKRIEMALANSRVKLSAADTSEIRKSVETALLDAVKSSSSSIASTVGNAIKTGVSKVKLNIDGSSLATSVENALKGKTMNIKGLSVNANDLGASIKTALQGKTFYVDVQVNQGSLVKSINQALASANQLGVSATNANNVATGAVQRHSRSYRPLSEQMKTTTQLATVLGNTMGNLFSVYAVKNFLESIVQIGGELEKQKLAMSAIIGDAHDAQIIFKQISDLSMISPFDVQDLVKYTKQLSAFGIQYDKLYDTTRRLSDLAAGVGVSFGRIAYEFGQTSARGWLDGRELRMFANSGIPLLQKLADLYSEIRGEAVSAAEVREMVTNRQVSFEDVEKVIKRMTDEGGEFYKMQEVMAESLAAKWRNLGNDWNLMMGQIAEGDVGNSLKGLAEKLMKVVENWKLVIATAKSFAYCLVVWKSYNYLANLGAESMGKNAIYFGKATKAANGLVLAFNKIVDVIKNNLGFIAVTAVVTLYNALSELYSEYKKYEDTVNNVGRRIGEQYNDVASSIDILKNKIKNAQGDQEEYNKLIDQMQNKYGEYVGNLIKEAQSYDDIAIAAERAKEAIKEKIRQQELESTISTINEKYNKEYKELNDELSVFAVTKKDSNGKIVAKSVRDSFVTDVSNALKEGYTANEIKAALSTVYDKVFVEGFFEESVWGGYRNSSLEDFIDLVKEQKTDIQKAMDGAGGTDLYKNILAPINKYYDSLEKATNDENKKLDIQIERLKTIKKLFETGSIELNGKNYDVIVNQNMADKYEKEIEVIQRKIASKWYTISNEVFGKQRLFSKEAGGADMSQIIKSDLGTKKDENDYLTYLTRLAEAYKKLKDSIKKRNAVGNKDAISDPESLKKLEKEQQMIKALEEYAERLGITWEDFEKKQKKGTGTDKQLKEWKARVDAIKEYYTQYKKFYTEYEAVQDSVTAKKNALTAVNKSGLFDPWKGVFEPPTNINEYKNLLQSVYDEIASAANTDERRKLMETLMKLINLDIFADQLKEDISDAVDSALKKAQEDLVKNKEKYNFWKKLFETTGERPDVITEADDWITFLRNRISKMLNESNKGMDPLKLLGLSDDSLKGLTTNDADIQALKEYLKAYKDAYEDEAKEIHDSLLNSYKTMQTSLQSFKAMYAKYIEERIKITGEKNLQIFDEAFLRNSVDAVLKVVGDNDGLIGKLLAGKLGNWQGDINQARKSIKNLIEVIEDVDVSEDNPYKDSKMLETMKGNEELVSKLLLMSNDIKDVWYKLGEDGIGGVVGGIGRAFEQYSSLKIFTSHIKNLKKGSSAYKNELKAIQALEEEIAMSMGETFMAALGIAHKISNTMKEVAEIMGNEGLADVYKFWGGIADVIENAWEGFKSSGSWIGAVVGGAEALLSAYLEGVKEAAEYTQKAKQSWVDYTNALTLNSVTIDESKYDSIFGTNAISKLADSWDAATNALQKYYDYVNKADNNKSWADAGQYSLDGDFDATYIDKLSASLGAYAKGYNDLQAIAVKTGDSGNWFQQHILSKKDTYTLLKDYAPDLWDKDGEFNVENAKTFLQTNKLITEEQRKQIQQAIDLKEAYDEAIEIIDQQLSSWFGSWSSTMSDAIFDYILSGVDAWDMFEKSGNEAILNIGKTMLQSKFFEAYFNQFTEELENAVATNDDGTAMISTVTKMFSGLPALMDKGTKFADAYNELAKQYGWDLASSGNSLSSSIKGVSEQTADILAAYINAIRADVSIERTAMESIYGTQLPQLQATADSQLIQLNQQTEYLRLIQASNDGIYEKIDSIDSKFSGITTGVKKVFTA